MARQRSGFAGNTGAPYQSGGGKGSRYIGGATVRRSSVGMIAPWAWRPDAFGDGGAGSWSSFPRPPIAPGFPSLSKRSSTGLAYEGTTLPGPRLKHTKATLNLERRAK